MFHRLYALLWRTKQTARDVKTLNHDLGSGCLGQSLVWRDAHTAQATTWLRHINCLCIRIRVASRHEHCVRTYTSNREHMTDNILSFCGVDNLRSQCDTILNVSVPAPLRHRGQP